MQCSGVGGEWPLSPGSPGPLWRVCPDPPRSLQMRPDLEGLKGYRKPPPSGHERGRKPLLLLLLLLLLRFRHPWPLLAAQLPQ